MRVLFIHQNFPAQFVNIAKRLRDKGHQVVALAMNGHDIAGIKTIRYKPKYSNGSPATPYVTDFETKIIRGLAVRDQLWGMQKEGFSPDLIVGHPGWGEMLFVREIYPRVKQVHYLEYFYNSDAVDSTFDSEFLDDVLDIKAMVKSKQASPLISLQEMDYGYSPTKWQKSTFPDIYSKHISVIYDGIDTNIVSPDNCQLEDVIRYPTKNGLFEIGRGEEVLTFVSRNLEPYRGYHKFMRSLPIIMEGLPKLKVVIVGGDSVSYGKKPPQSTWKEIFYDEVRGEIDDKRIVFTGKLKYSDYLALLRITKCHVYLTYPFVLSWSMLEAMSMGCVVVGSNTPPVTEFLEPNINGLLVDFFDVHEIADRVIYAIKNYDFLKKTIGINARDHIREKYDLNNCCLPAIESFYTSLI